MKTVLIWLTLCFGTLMTTCANGTAYLFSYFINDSKDGLHLAYSYDGLNWTALNGGKSYLTPAVGKDKLMRDPSICQATDGTFHMVWTFSWTDLDYRLCLFPRLGSLERAASHSRHDARTDCPQLLGARTFLR